MPSGRKKRPPEIIVDEAKLEADRERYRLDLEAFLNECVHVVDRDRAGEIVLLGPNLRYIQRQLLDTIQRARAFNIAKSLLRAGAEAAARFIFEMPANVAFPTKAKKLVELIRNFGVDRFLDRIKKAGVKAITDGPIRLMIGKPRQVGISTLIQAILLWCACFTPFMKAGVVAHEQPAAENVLDFVATFYATWPEETLHVRPGMPGEAKKHIEFDNRSKFWVRTAGGSDVRSWKFDRLHLSEYAHYESLMAIAAGLSAVPKHCWIFKESTANGAKGRFYEEWQKAKFLDEYIEAFDDNVDIDEFGYIKFFSKWLDDPEYTLPVSPWEEEAIRSTLTEYELSLLARFPDLVDFGRIKWRRDTIEHKCQGHESLMPEAFFAQEYPVDEEEMFQRVSGEVFNPARLKAMMENAKLLWAQQPPKMFRLEDNAGPRVVTSQGIANCFVYEPPIEGEQYLIGGDVATGRQEGVRDRSYATIWKRGDGTVLRLVAEYRGYAKPAAFGHILVLLAEWYNNAFVNPETWPGPGITTTATMVHECQYREIYIRRPSETIKTDEMDEFKYGFASGNGPIKQDLIYNCVQMVDLGLMLIRSPFVLEEMLNFERNEKAQLGAPPGKHDDAVLSSALAAFVSVPGHGAPRLKPRKKREKRPLLQPEVAGVDLKSQLGAHEYSILQGIAKLEAKMNKKNGFDADGKPLSRPRRTL